MRVLGCLVVWASLPLLATAADEASDATSPAVVDWSFWRGPEMNGVSRQQNLPAEWSLEPKKNVLWTSDIGGRATPCVMNGRVFLNCRTDHNVSVGHPELIDAGEQVVCWDANTGELLWQDKFNVFSTDIPSPRIGWASITGDPETGNIFVHSVSGTLICYSADGERLWEKALHEDFGELLGYGGRQATPLIDEDRLILAMAGRNWGETGPPPPKHYFYAFDKRTGELLWVSAPGGPLEDTFYTNPVIAVVDGVRQLISGGGDGGVYGIEARTGKPLWSFKMSKRGLNSSVVVEDNRVYVSHGEDNIDTSIFGRVQCIDASLRGDITKTGSLWRVDGVKAGYASPCLHDGILYAVSDDGVLIAFDAADGKKLWEHRLGTVGKGSPVWADGKLYVMEVNGRVHILKPSREKCEVLSDVTLHARVGSGNDEIAASPAIADGKVYFVTRDRTICIGLPDAEAASAEIPAPAEEKPAGSKIATLKLVPYEVNLKAGETVDYELHAFDENGRFIKTIKEFELTPDANLDDATVEKNTVTTTADAKLPQAGTVTATVDGQTVKARIRSFPPLPWKWDMEGLTGRATPPGWVGATALLVPTQLDGNTVLKSVPGPGKPGSAAWIGPSDLKNYVIQADVRVDGRRSLSSVGVTNNRYDMVLKANQLKLSLSTWPAHLRLNTEQKLSGDPAGKWYTVKFAVDVVDGKAQLKGKLWPRDEEEPAEWTIETTDPHANVHGAPGLFVYRLSEAYFDNVIISEPEDAAASE